MEVAGNRQHGVVSSTHVLQANSNSIAVSISNQIPILWDYPVIAGAPEGSPRLCERSHVTYRQKPCHR